MRFLPQEHQAITEALIRHGIDPATVLFVKRRGRLHVQLPGRTGTFVFFRSSSTSLDADGRWVERTDHFIGEGQAATPRTWPEVVEAFTAWLAAPAG